ncbi:A/G-specific adenine glycosylase [Luteimonas pelagia]
MADPRKPVAADAPFAVRLLDWFDTHGRHDLPWQHPRTPYRVWLSEIMLQQTQVSVVVPYFEQFVGALPDVPALAAAPLDEVLALWSGLGYYARARNLHAAAKRCVEVHDGDLPRDLDALVALPGIGRSTAAAIASQAWRARAPILDGNVKRVLARYHGIDGWPGSAAVEKQLWSLADAHVADPALADARLPDYTQAQMDLGATVCTRHAPACPRCPLQRDCVAHRAGRTGELPTPRPARTVPGREATILVLRDHEGRVLLERRPPSGIWGGLWSLPQLPDDEEARGWFARHVRGDFDAAVRLPSVEHGFTHFRLRMQPLLWDGIALQDAVRDNPGLRPFAMPRIAALGLPAPIRRLLHAPHVAAAGG